MLKVVGITLRRDRLWTVSRWTSTGDSLLAPRQVLPSAWAFVGNDCRQIALISFAPANKMEAFFRDNAERFQQRYNILMTRPSSGASLTTVNSSARH